MNWSNQTQQTSFYLQMMEKRIAQNDVLRIIDDKIDLSFINVLCSPYYSTLGPQGYCPERLFRMLIIMYLANIRSERQLVKELNENLRYMWFAKIDLDSPIPDHSTFSVLRQRLGDELFKQIFEQILSQMFNLNIVKPKAISVDSTCVLADVKFPRKKDHNIQTEDKQVISPNDMDARYGHKSPKQSFFGYKAQMMVDNDSGAILNIDAQSGNFDDKQLDQNFIKEPLTTHNMDVHQAALDKGFDSYAIRKFLKNEHIQAAIPLKKFPDPNVLSLDHFDVDVKKLNVTCPNQESMSYQGFDSKQRTHQFVASGCSDCHLKLQCTTSSKRRVAIHEDYALKQEAKAFNQTPKFRHIYNRRNCVERVIGEAKRFHGLVRSKFRARWKLKIQCFLTAIVINLKRVAKFFAQQYAYGFT